MVTILYGFLLKTITEKISEKIKNPTSQDESGVFIKINHDDRPLRVKGTELIDFNIQGKFGDVKREKGSELRVQSSEVK